MEVYSNSEQSNYDNDEVTKTPKNLEEFVQAEGTLGNSEINKTMLENVEEPAHIGETLSKGKELENRKEPAHTKGTFSKLRKNIESVVIATPKASVLVIPAKDSDLASLYTSCITSKQT